MVNYEGGYLTPGIQADRETHENHFWFGKEEQQVWAQGVILGTARDAGNTGATTTLRAGLLLGKVTASGKLKEWNPSGTDGSEVIFGILRQSVYVQRLGADADRISGTIWVGGLLKTDRVLVPGAGALGIASNAQEHNIKMQLGHRAVFANDYDAPAADFNRIIVKTADYTVLEADNGTMFTTRGAAGAVNFTLPATAKLGLRYRFFNVADQNMTVTAGTADTMVTLNDAAADSVSFQTTSEKIGGAFEVVGDGTGWLVMPILAAEAQTITVVTA